MERIENIFQASIYHIEASVTITILTKEILLQKNCGKMRH